MKFVYSSSTLKNIDQNTLESCVSHPSPPHFQPSANPSSASLESENQEVNSTRINSTQDEIQASSSLTAPHSPSLKTEEESEKRMTESTFSDYPLQSKIWICGPFSPFFKAFEGILILGFRASCVLFLLTYPICRLVISLLRKDWILKPLTQGIEFVLKPLTYLEVKQKHLSFTSVPAHKKKDINRALLEDLCEVEGVGSQKAQEIIDYRTEYGAFRRMEELGLIKGIGAKTFRLLLTHFDVYSSDPNEIRSSENSNTSSPLSFSIRSSFKAYLHSSLDESERFSTDLAQYAQRHLGIDLKASDSTRSQITHSRTQDSPESPSPLSSSKADSSLTS